MRIVQQASRLSAQLSEPVRVCPFDCIAKFRIRPGFFVLSTFTRLSYKELNPYEESRAEAMDPVAEGCKSWRELIYRFFDSDPE